MTATRQDAWTQDEDLLLAEVVLRHIREGGTQLAAFEEVAKKLSRTSAACGFRWNSYVRKQYKTGIELAKKQRKEHRKKRKSNSKSIPQQTSDYSRISTNNLTLDEVIHFLQQLDTSVKVDELQNENERLQKEVQNFEEKIVELKKENHELKEKIQEIESDYHALIEIMERARRMVVLNEEEREQKVKFQMDKNGNLERVEK